MFFHNSSKIEYRWISLNAFEMSSAIMTQAYYLIGDILISEDGV